MLKDLLRSPAVRVALLVACGTALLPSCAGGGLPPVSVFLLAGVVALGGWLSACSRALSPSDAATGPDAATGGTGGTDAATVEGPPRARCLTDADFDDSQPYAEGAGPGWTLCCLRGETRLCPSEPTVSCNYGQGTTFRPDGTCGWAFGDAAVDAPADATVADATPDVARVDAAQSCSGSCFLAGGCFDSSLPNGNGIPAGWMRCCLQGQTRLCLDSSTVACNYALGTIFNPDDTCGWGFDGAAGDTVSAADATTP